MKLHNTLTRQLTDFNPTTDTITIYTCGPTVYRDATIGNLASYIFADTLKRTLAAIFPDKQIKHVMNITDVDDKTIAQSTKLYPDLEPKEALTKLTREVEEKFVADLVAVGINVADYQFVRATEHIDTMQALIMSLVKTGVAYVADDGVYFSIAKYKEAGKTYGQLSQVTVSSTSRARILNDEYAKEEAHDFALWKAAKEDEPSWPFEIEGKSIAGRPGWHIECSAMSAQYLGQPFDIHTGGVDLIFPHHENEIAQSTAGSQDTLARVFMHSQHLLVDGQKMAKSADNFFTLDDVKAKGFDPLAFRLFVLQGHYRSQLNFTWEGMAAAQNRLNSLRNLAELRFQTPQTDKDLSPKLISSLANDLNTPTLLAQLDVDASQVKALIKLLDSWLGLKLAETEDASSEVKDLLERRMKAKQAKDFDLADSLRDELKTLGYGVRDNEDGQIWYRIYK